jgi:hypothetical protein
MQIISLEITSLPYKVVSSSSHVTQKFLQTGESKNREKLIMLSIIVKRPLFKQA